LATGNEDRNEARFAVDDFVKVFKGVCIFVEAGEGAAAAGKAD